MRPSPLFGQEADKEYLFEDIDSGERRYLSGKVLLSEGFFVTLKEKRKAKIYLYKEI